VGAKVTLAETNPGSNVRPSTIALAAVGALLLLFECFLLLTTTSDDVSYQWAQAGALIGGLLLALAGLRFALWDRRRL
jgi:hypothetical protein